MPFSLLVHLQPQDDLPSFRMQGNVLHAVFFELIDRVDPKFAARLHADNRYRPFTISPLASGTQLTNGRGFCFARQRLLKKDSPCLFRISLLDDELFPVFSKSLLDMRTPSLRCLLAGIDRS